jgi:hypothetical protein
MKYNNVDHTNGIRDQRDSGANGASGHQYPSAALLHMNFLVLLSTIILSASQRRYAGRIAAGG